MKQATTPSLPAQYNGRFIAGAKWFSGAAGVLSSLVGALVLAGWLFDVPVLKSVYGGITMKANAALSFLLAGASLWLTRAGEGKSPRRRVGQVCAAVTALTGLLTLSEHVSGLNLGIDQLLFTEAAGALATSSPGRMGPLAASCFSLAGVALLLFHARRAVALSQLLSVAICLLALLPIIGYTYGAEALYGIAGYTGIALHTAVTLFVLGMGLLGARAGQGPIAVIADDRAGGLMARRLLMAAVCLPFILGWLRLLGQRAGYFDLGFGAAAMVLSIIVLFSAFIWQSAARLSQTEQQRLAAEAVVREKEEGLRQQAALIELSYEPIFVWELGGGIIEWNAGCERLYGYAREEAVGQSNHQLLGAEFPALPGEQLRALARDGHWSGELRHRTREGREVIIESRRQLLDSGGRRLVLETNHDITERKRAEAEREQQLAREQGLRAEAELSNRLKDEFLATVSHELRTPLTAIIGWAHLLDNAVTDEETVRRGVSVIRRNAMQQTRIVEDLLDASRIISGKLKLETGRVELADVVEAAIETVRPSAEARNVRLLPAVGLRAAVAGDPHRLQQVVWNLLSNAVKFTPAGGVVRVSVEPLLTHARIEVSDTGQGIAPEFLPYVFDRFRQADGSTTRQHGGLGLGLSIVRHLVEAHGGSVHAYSAGEGQGATFTVDLPLAAGAEGAVSNTPNIGNAQREEIPATFAPVPGAGRAEALPPLVGLRVLLVDDDGDTLEMLTTFLRSAGAAVTAVQSAAAALEALGRGRPDVIVADVGMPRMDGYELMRKVRSLGTERGGHVPALALTAYAGDSDRAQALRSGFQSHLAKPPDPAVLVSVIADLAASARTSPDGSTN